MAKFVLTFGNNESVFMGHAIQDSVYLTTKLEEAQKFETLEQARNEKLNREHWAGKGTRYELSLGIQIIEVQG